MMGKDKIVLDRIGRASDRLGPGGCRGAKRMPASARG